MGGLWRQILVYKYEECRGKIESSGGRRQLGQNILLAFKKGRSMG
jgi:hypothetical protein